jgi:GTP-binding protein
VKIVHAEFLISAAQAEQFPADHVPEVCFAGRSNVGKSSMINSLLQRKQLARVGNSPGKTRLINFFTVHNGAFRFVDLPGYGYAKVSKSEKDIWKRLIESYLTNQRKNIKGIIHIIDARHPVNENDIMLSQFLFSHAIKSCLVATKTDKLNQKETNKLVQEIMSAYNSKPVLFSSATGKGREPVLDTIEQWVSVS